MKLKKVLVLALIALCSCCTLFAASSTEEACWLGNKQAEKEGIQSMFIWMGLGCVTGPIAVVLSFNDEPKPNMSLVMGKPANYTARYVKCYKDAMKTGNIAGAIGGCTIAGLVATGMFFAWPYLF